MTREPLWLYAATDEPFPHPEDNRRAIADGWLRRPFAGSSPWLLSAIQEQQRREDAS